MFHWENKLGENRRVPYVGSDRVFLEFVGGPILIRLDGRPDDVGSKYKENGGLEGTEVALINVRKT